MDGVYYSMLVVLVIGMTQFGGLWDDVGGKTRYNFWSHVLEKRWGPVGGRGWC